MNITNKYLIVAISLICWSYHLTAQDFYTLPADAFEKPIIYQNLYESKNGIIWLGTNAGLAYFNGLTFQYLQNNGLLENQTITAIGENDNGLLFIGTKSGEIFRQNNEQFSKWELEEGHPKVPITGVESYDGKMWFSTYGEGVYVHDGKHLYNINIDDGLLSNDIYEMEKESQGIWLATDAGINITNFIEGKKRILSLQKKDGLLDEIVLHVRAKENRQMEVGYFDTGTSVINAFDLSMIHHVENNYETDLVDEEGNKWHINIDKGIKKNQSLFNFYSFENGPIQAILSLKENLILGTPTGLYSFDKQSSTSKVLLEKEINFISLELDDHGNIWAGSFGDGVYCYNKAFQQILHLTSADGIAENSILDIDISGNRILLGTLGGITEMTLNKSDDLSNIKIKNIGYNEGLGTNYVYVVKQTPSNKIIIGMDGQGVSIVDGEVIKGLNKNDFENGLTVFNTTLLSDNSLLFGTSEDGVISSIYSDLVSYPLWSKTFEKEIFGLKSFQNKIFINTSRGIYFKSENILNFAIYDYGIVANNFIPTLNASYLDNQNIYWIGGSNGLIEFNIERNPKRVIPEIGLLNVKLFDQNIDTTNKKRFKYNENYITFEYIGKWYSAPEKLNFQYRLFGLEDDWIATSESHVVYHHLPAGKYTFRIRASLSNDFDQSNIASFSFRVSPPIWRHPLFIISIILLLSLLWFLYLKYRENRIAEREMLNREKLEAKYQALKSYINPHFLFNSFNTLIGAIEDDPQSAVTYVEKLSDFYRSILLFREKNLIPIKEELEVVENYVSLLKERFGDGLHLKIEELDPNILIVPLCLQLLVENAVKHNIVSGDQPLYITIEEFENSYILVRNNLQRKGQLEPSTKYGLNNLNTRYKLLSDRPVIVEESDKEFRVLIPKIKMKNNEGISH